MDRSSHTNFTRVGDVYFLRMGGRSQCPASSGWWNLHAGRITPTRLHVKSHRGRDGSGRPVGRRAGSVEPRRRRRGRGWGEGGDGGLETEEIFPERGFGGAVGARNRAARARATGIERRRIATDRLGTNRASVGAWEGVRGSDSPCFESRGVNLEEANRRTRGAPRFSSNARVELHRPIVAPDRATRVHLQRTKHRPIAHAVFQLDSIGGVDQELNLLLRVPPHRVRQDVLGGGSLGRIRVYARAHQSLGLGEEIQLGYVELVRDDVGIAFESLAERVRAAGGE